MSESASSFHRSPTAASSLSVRTTPSMAHDDDDDSDALLLRTRARSGSSEAAFLPPQPTMDEATTTRRNHNHESVVRGQAGHPQTVQTRLMHALPPQLSQWFQRAPSPSSVSPSTHRTHHRHRNRHHETTTGLSTPLDSRASSSTISFLHGGLDLDNDDEHRDTTGDHHTAVATPLPAHPGRLRIDPPPAAPSPAAPAVVVGDLPPAPHSPSPSTTSTTSSSSSGDDDSSTPLVTPWQEFQTLFFRRGHHSLPFIALFVVYFAYQHALGLLVFVIGSVAIAGLDTRVKMQIALKEHASRMQLYGIFAMALVDSIVVSFVDGGNANPWKLLGRKLPLPVNEDADAGGLIFQVLWLVMINDLIIRLWSLALKALVAVVDSEFLLCGCRRPVVVSGLPPPAQPGVERDEEGEGTRRKLTRSNAAFYRRKRKLYGIIELFSLFLRSLLAGIPWCSYYQLCGSKFMGDVFTFIYIFGKGLILGGQGRRLFTLIHSFMTIGLEHATYVTQAELVEAGCPDCSICYDPMQAPVKLVSCSHMFCEACVMEWFDRERSCPLCRTAIATPMTPRNDKPEFLDGSTNLFPQLF